MPKSDVDNFTVTVDCKMQDQAKRASRLFKSTFWKSSSSLDLHLTPNSHQWRFSPLKRCFYLQLRCVDGGPTVVILPNFRWCWSNIRPTTGPQQDSFTRIHSSSISWWQQRRRKGDTPCWQGPHPSPPHTPILHTHTVTFTPSATIIPSANSGAPAGP